MTAAAHVTVLREAAVDLLVTRPDGFYIDGTFGRGGHSRALLARLTEAARLLVVDKDPEAIALARAWQAEEPRLSVHHGSFAELPAVVAQAGLPPADGVLLDLGVSSPQPDDPDRGFSFQQDGPLDMRMDTRSGPTAADWLAAAPEAEIRQVLFDYGEERFARRIAAAIVRSRAEAPILRTGQLARIVSEANPRWERHKHPATRAFQAIRIRINEELADLEALLEAVLPLLAVGGRLVVISFHSLEDRLVKRSLRRQSQATAYPRGVPVRADQDRPPMRLLGRSVRASEEEVAANPRARSAVLRAAERVA